MFHQQGLQFLEDLKIETTLTSWRCFINLIKTLGACLTILTDLSNE